MSEPHLVPLDEQMLPAAVRLCADGLRQIAGRAEPWLLRLPDVSAEQLAETALGRYLGEEAAAEGRSAWAAVDDRGIVRAVMATLAVDLEPDDWRFTFMPPRSVTVPSSVLHAAGQNAARMCFPTLLEHGRKLAADMGQGRLFVQVAPGDADTTVLWRELGLTVSTVMARQPMKAWRMPPGAAGGVDVRVAAEADVESLTDLALEEHRYHAEHTSSGVSPHQRRETSRRVAADAVAASPETSRQLVAVDGSGVLVGSIVGTIQEVADDQVQRYLLPPRYGYIGLTSVTASARGIGVGRTMLRALMTWFAEQGIDAVFLHYAADNPSSSRFWTRAGFASYIEIYSDPGG